MFPLQFLSPPPPKTGNLSVPAFLPSVKFPDFRRTKKSSRNDDYFDDLIVYMLTIMLVVMLMMFSMVFQDGVPETAGDFERLMVAEPNSSLLWVKYMAFKLSLADVEVSVISS